ncbi:MAG: TIM-barrel domain-containing protein, partial [Lachnospiraceae bacterium]
GIFNYRKVNDYLYQNNMKIPMPVFMSSHGYAIVFDASCMMTYEEKDNIITVTFDAVDEISYFVIVGKNFDELISGIRCLTGNATMLPRWAFGYIQSKERYHNQDEILDTIAEFNKREIPVSCIVLDWMSWEDGQWGNKIFDKTRFADAKDMVKKLHAQGVAFMISVWPNMNRGTANNEEMAKEGKLLCNFSTYDAFDEEARALYWKQCERELFAAGTDAWWCDSTEPFTPDWNGSTKRADEERYQMAKDSTNCYLDARVSNTYALAHAKGIYENQRKVCKDKRVVNLTRSGSIGSQRYGTVLWSGDIAATWDIFKKQIAEGLSMCMSGIPYWTLDIGAFFTGTLDCWRRFTGQLDAVGPQPWFWHGLFENGVKDLGYRELYVRWLQCGTFLPIMRSHGTDTPREPWHFGEKGSVFYDTIVKYIKKRYHMMPYTYSLAAMVKDDNYTIMRSLMFDFANDELVKDRYDSYMFGPSYLVHPITHAIAYEANSKKISADDIENVYLPKGNFWYEEATDNCYLGGQTVRVKASIDTMPLFIKAGSIIPMSMTDEGSFDSIHVYDGQDGNFTLYIDNGIDYAYENGAYAKVKMQYNAESKILLLCEKMGKLPFEANINVIFHDGKQIKTTKLYYNGKECSIMLKEV